VYSKYSSLHEITAVLRGNDGVTRLLDVLNSSKLMKPINFSGLDYQAVFESTSLLATPKNIGIYDEKLSRNLYLL
jgi:hypothetical protein